MLQVGIVLFAAGAFIAGLALNGTMLILGRGLQGLGAALTAPNALASITSTFPPGKHRNLALGMYAAMSGLGIAIGLLLGGLLTGTLGWSWMFFINIPIALLLLLGTRTVVEAERHPGRLDVPGGLLGTAAMASLVYAITRGGEHGWTDPGVIGFLVAAAVLLIVFLFAQSRTTDPLLPLRSLTTATDPAPTSACCCSPSAHGYSAGPPDPLRWPDRPPGWVMTTFSPMGRSPSM